MIYSLFLYKYQVQNTANAAPRRVYDTIAAPSTHRKRLCKFLVGDTPTN